ncbi:hypothetical protein ACSBR1_036462 [Camellia fascicularis]
MEQRKDGGWIPVVKQKGRQANHDRWNAGRRPGLYTLFVDNLPDSMEPRSMYALFIKFGVVKDVFIPQKRRKTTNTRFGFVRFDCPVVAKVAEQKANGLWVDDKALTVQNVVYAKEKCERMRLKQVQWRHMETKRPSEITGTKRWNQDIDGRSFAKVTKGVQPRGKTTTTIRIEEIGNGWLCESMIMRLKPNYFTIEVKQEIKAKGV